MANEGGSTSARVVSFALRLIVSLILPAWGLIMLIVGIEWGMGWWIASRATVLAIGIVFLAGSSLATPFLPGGRKLG